MTANTRGKWTNRDLQNNTCPGMGPNVAVLHVDDSNFASGLLNFNF